MKTPERSLAEVLSSGRSTIVEEWLKRTIQSYPESAGRFLSQEKDPFRNPVGHTLKAGLAELFDGLTGPPDTTAAGVALDGIVRIRAVQDFSAGQAVAFVFLLKKIIRDLFPEHVQRCSYEAAALESRIDDLALLAFDIFMRCREQIIEIQAKEAKRRVAVLEKAYRMRSSESTC